MSRRRVVVLASAATLFALGALVMGSIATATRTAWGREQLRARAEAFINSKIQGKMHIGRVSGSLFTEIVVDSFALRESNDSLFIATGRIRLRFDPRDILDRRILIRDLDIEHAHVRLEEDSTKTWNFRKIFPPGPPSPPRTTSVPGFGDFIVVNATTIRRLSLDLTMPWEPDDSLRAAKRDSAITYALQRDDKIIRPVGSHYQITRTWTNGVVQLGRSRIDDRELAGRQFHVLRLDADEFDPPFEFRELRGQVRLRGDSLWTEIEHFALPGSSGSASGKVWWGGGIPTRYDLTVVADTVSLADVAWVYPTLPTTGGGRMTLRIRSQDNPELVDYVLSEMDVRTMGSRLRGTMTFATGAPVFIIKDIDVRGEPLDWAFIEEFVGEPLPYPWRGTIDATVRASGGAINRFRIEEGRFLFRDANVPGATARGVVRGELDMLDPALTVFRAFHVNLDHFDLRTMQFLNPEFPRFSGLVSGTATLDSVWTDLRFRGADITHRFAEGGPSRFRGNGRVTIGDEFLVYDLAVEAEPLDLTTIARAYPEAELLFRGTMSGPIRLQGAVDDLIITTSLTGEAGSITWDGHVDADSVGGYGYRGRLDFAGLDLRALYDTSSMPRTSLFGVANVDLVGDSLRNYVGSLNVALERSLVDSVRIFGGSRARVRFADDRLYVDTLYVESTLATVAASGALGLAPAVRDSVVATLAADSLGALRRYLFPADSTGAAPPTADSLAGVFTGRATLTGSIDTLQVRAAMEGDDVVYGDYRARRLRMALNLENASQAEISGTASLTADTVVLSTVAVSTLGLDVTLRGRERFDYTLLSTLANGPVLSSKGLVRLAGDTTTLDLSQFRVAFGDHDWELTRPAVIASSPERFSIDSLVVAGSDGGRLALDGVVPAVGEVALHVVADSLAMGDLAALSQSGLALGGALSARLELAGSRASPVMTLLGAVDGARIGQVNVARAILEGRYADRRIDGRLAIVRGDTTVVDVSGTYPIDLALEGRSSRVVADTLRVALRSDALDMKVVESFFPSLSNSSGRLSADFALSGRTNRTSIDGFLRIDSVQSSIADLGIRIRDFNADLVAERDTLRIRRFAMVSGPERRDSLWLGGLVVLGTDDPTFDVTLGAREFNAIDRRNIANLTISSDLRLSGALSASALSGSVTVNRGFVVIPEFTGKEVISLEDFASLDLVDTTLFSNRSLLPKAPPAFVQNLTIRNVQIAMGPEVWLRSAEANINIGGAVNVIVGRRFGSSATPQLALEGTLQTVRGTYRLALGPVQRTFTIERGTLSFYGDPDLNPVLDINAIHTVRQFSAGVGARNDVRVRVRLLGTFVRPSIVLESADSLQLSDSDLISYLVVGTPSFEIGGLQYSNLLIGGLGSYLSSRLSGRLFDYVQIQTASGPRDAQAASRAGLFAGAEFGVGKQLGERTFVSLTTGLCTFQQVLAGNSQLDPATLTQALGVSLEQRLARGYGFSLSLEPPTTTIFCGAQANVGVTATRQQVGFDFFRAWRW